MWNLICIEQICAGACLKYQLRNNSYKLLVIHTLSDSNPKITRGDFHLLHSYSSSWRHLIGWPGSQVPDVSSRGGQSCVKLLFFRGVLKPEEWGLRYNKIVYKINSQIEEQVYIKLAVMVFCFFPTQNVIHW